MLVRPVIAAVVAVAALMGGGPSVAPASQAESVGPSGSSMAGGLLPPVLAPPPTPDHDPFYRPPAELDRYDEGELIRTRPGSALLDPRRLPANHVWQILYRSTTTTGHPDAVSGTVFVPDLPWTGPGTRPLVTYAIATHGFAARCAPSYELSLGIDPEAALIDQALLRGWAVSVTDYEGLGTPGPHTYFVNRSEGHAVLDAARAAMRLDGAGIRPDAPVGIWGYSQGGGAAGEAAELAHDYAPELRTVGVAEGGVVADILTNLRNAATLPVANGFLPAVIDGYDRAYPDLNLDRLYTDAGRRSRDSIRGQCLEALALNAATPPSRAFVTDPLSYRPLVEKLADNNLGHTLPAMPVLIYNGTTDEFAVYGQALDLFRTYCNKGGRVELLDPPGEHLAGAFVFAPPAVQWLADRFAGHTAPDTCPHTIP